jgi:hypothetical protein
MNSRSDYRMIERPLPRIRKKKEKMNFFEGFDVGKAFVFETRKEALTMRQRCMRAGIKVSMRQFEEGFGVWRVE